jgi:hypothetical protein
MNYFPHPVIVLELWSELSGSRLHQHLLPALGREADLLRR